MRSKLIKVIFLTLIIFVVALLFKASFASSSSIEDKRREVDKLQSQIDYYQNLAKQKAKQINSLTAQVEKMNAEIKVTELNITRTQKNIDLTQAEIDETKAQIKQKEAELAYQKSVLDEALRTIYEEGNTGFLESFLTAETLSDLMDRTEYLDSVSNSIEVTMAKIADIKADLLAKKKSLEDKRASLNVLLGQQEATRLALRSQRSEKDRLLAETRGEQSRYNQITQRKLEEFKKSSSELKRLEEAARRGIDAPSSSGFIWPLRGWISAEFGACGCSAYFCGLCHYGIDIVAPAGSPIVASKGGRAYKRYDAGGYGNYVLIDHGDDFTTIYGHMQAFAGFSSGSQVDRGRVIGYVGSTGFSTGPHLHFEVRYNGVPINPRNYLP